MELQELTNKVLRLFDAKTTEDLPEKLLAAVQNNDETVYEKFCENVKDLSIDWLQMIFSITMQIERKKCRIIHLRA